MNSTDVPKSSSRAEPMCFRCHRVVVPVPRPSLLPPRQFLADPNLFTNNTEALPRTTPRRT